LLLDAPERADGNIALRMRDSDAASFGRVLELNVAALLSYLLPPVLAERGDDISASHAMCINTHCCDFRNTKKSGLRFSQQQEVVSQFE
jgi:hypothetical protein